MSCRLKCTGSRTTIVSVAVIIALLPGQALAQAAVLDDNSLAAVTALIRSNHVPSSDSVPSAIVAADSQARFVSSFEVRLAEQTQSGIQAGSVVNASVTDIAAGVNVLGQRAMSGPMGVSRSNASQQNQLIQNAIDDNRLEYFSETAPSFTLTTQQNHMSSRVDNLSRHIEFIDRQVVFTSRTTRFSATASAERPNLLDGLSIGNRKIALPDFVIGPSPFTIDIKTPGDRVDAFKVTISPPNLRVSGASLNTGSISFENDQIVFAAPVLNLPDLKFKYCLLERRCETDEQRRTLTIKGGSFELGPGTSLDNPVSAYGVGVGYAVAGNGSVEKTDGNVHIGGSIPVDIGAIANLALVVAVPVFGDADITLDSLNLPVFQIPIDIDIPLALPDAVQFAVENEACVFSNGARECNPLDVTTTEFQRSDEGSTETASSEQARTENYFHQQHLRQDAEVLLDGAEATFIVVDDSSGHASRYSVVVVDDSSQIDVRALNLVNSSMGIIGNTLNVAQSRPTRQVDVVQSAFQQVNRITQIGGL